MSLNMLESLLHISQFILHFDKYLNQIIQDYGGWVYCLLFLIIFFETGIVVTPFLPGDSLLFAVGAFAAIGALNFFTVLLSLIVAAILGDTVNYSIGKFLGPKVFCQEQARFFNKRHLEQTQRFFAKYGSKTIILARFVPIVRTFAPFVAGIGRMRYGTFLFYNVLGGILWVSFFVSCGYFLGNIPFIKEHFSIVVLIIIFLSILPVVFEVIKYFRKKIFEEAKTLDRIEIR